MSTALAGAPLMTAEQFFELPDDGLRHELIEGVVVSMPPPGFEHGRVCATVTVTLGVFVRDHQHVGTVLCNDPGVVLRRGPDTVRAPDVAVVSPQRMPPPQRRSWFTELVPDLVVEVVSPSDRASEVSAKAVAWLDGGARVVWVVDPQTRLVAVHRPDGVVHLLREDAVLTEPDVLPGFTVPVAELFS